MNQPYFTIDLNIYLRHLVNIDILQRGWNYITLRFISDNPINLKLIQSKTFAFDMLDKKDPRRFVDQQTNYVYDDELKMIVTPAFRIEYFDQIVQLNQWINLQLTTKDNDIIIEQSIHFFHCQKQMTDKAPAFANCDKVYSHHVQLHDLAIPCIRAFSEHFNEIHFAALQMTFLFKVLQFENNMNHQFVEQQGDIFESLYKDSYDDMVDYLKNSSNLSNFIKNDCLQEITMLDRMIMQFDYQSNAPINKQIEQIQSIKQKNNQNKPIVLKQLNNNEIDSKKFVETALQLRQNTPGAERCFVLSQGICKQLFLLHFQKPNQEQQILHTSTQLAKIIEHNISTRQYSEKQMQYYLTQMEKQREVIFQQKYYQSLKFDKNSKTKQRNVYIFVHGYKGSHNDLRYLKDLIKNFLQLQQRDDDAVYITPQKFYQENTCVLELGYNLLNEIKQKLCSQFNTSSAEQALEFISSINFISFSLGSVLIEAMLLAETIDDLKYEGVLSFNNQYKQLQSKEDRILLVKNQHKQLNKSIFDKFNIMFSVNGPVLGSTNNNGYVNTGIGFIKAFGKKDENQCVRDLENTSYTIKQLLEYRKKYQIIQKLIDSAQFDQIYILDLLAFHSRLLYFNKIILLGSFNDGYVDVESAVALLQDKVFIQAKYQQLLDVEKYIIVNDQKKFQQSGYFDRVSGKSVHISPIQDPETCEVLAKFIIKQTFLQ